MYEALCGMHTCARCIVVLGAGIAAVALVSGIIAVPSVQRRAGRVVSVAESTRRRIRCRRPSGGCRLRNCWKSCGRPSGSGRKSGGPYR